MTTQKLDYRIFDADNHYCEVDDTFVRFGDEKVRRHIRWVQEGKRRHLLFGNRMSTGFPTRPSTRSPSLVPSTTR
jgi:hypothetical protein